MKLIFKNRFSINTKLMISYIIIISITISIFSAIVYYGSNNAIKEIAQRNAEQIINSAHHNLLTLIDDINYEINSLQANKYIHEVLTSTNMNVINEINIIEDVLTNVDIFQRKITAIELVALSKENYPSLSSNHAVFSAKELANDVWFKTMMSSDYHIKWFVYDNTSVKENYIIASKLIMNTHTAEPVAIIKAKININNFTKLLDDIQVAYTGRVFLTTQTHIINPSQNEFIHSFTNNKILFGEMLNHQKNSRYIKINGEELLVVSAPLRDTGLYLVGAVKLKEFETSSASILRAIIITSIVTIFVSLMALFYTGSFITKPIITLARTMKNFSLEQTNISAHTNDEIGILYKAFNSMKSTIANLIDDVNKFARLQRNAELKALQAQITPHFLYNVLNSISAMAKRSNIPEIEKMICALASFFKHSLNNGNEFTTIRKELEHVISYVDIQKIRFGDAFNITIDVDEEIIDFPICKLILQPLVENCIVHAFEDISYTGQIRIRGYKDGNSIYILVSDNGLGANVTDVDTLNNYVNKEFDPDEPIEKYGIHNVNQRIKLYYGPEYGLSYRENEKGGLTAIVHISDGKTLSLT